MPRASIRVTIAVKLLKQRRNWWVYIDFSLKPVSLWIFFNFQTQHLEIRLKANACLDSTKYRAQILAKKDQKSKVTKKSKPTDKKDNPLKCDRCEKSYKDKKSFREHKKLHNGKWNWFYFRVILNWFISTNSRSQETTMQILPEGVFF